jgi:DNA-binding transcriptional ArsR family regulator
VHDGGGLAAALEVQQLLQQFGLVFAGQGLHAGLGAASVPWQLAQAAPRRGSGSPGPVQVFESVARYFGVLGEPTRLRILHTVCQEEKCVNDIIRATGMAQANVSRHLGLMYQAGMLSRRREGTQVFYRWPTACLWSCAAVSRCRWSRAWTRSTEPS